MSGKALTQQWWMAEGTSSAASVALPTPMPIPAQSSLSTRDRRHICTVSEGEDYHRCDDRKMEICTRLKAGPVR